MQDWRPGVQRTDGGKPKKAIRDDDNDDTPRVPFDARTETPAMPSDGSFQSTGQPSPLQVVRAYSQALLRH